MRVKNFKNCLSRFATGVAVVTSLDCDGMMCGITINSFNSVSLEPPLVLFSIEKKASRYSIFVDCNRFVVNILSEEQTNLSCLFAAHKLDSWNNISYKLNNVGVPMLQGILSYLDCQTESRYEGGDHTIILGRVIEAEKLSDAYPLLYFDHSYCRFGGKLS